MEDPAPETLKNAGLPERLKLVLEPEAASSAEIATWTAALTECRARTLKAIAGITQAELDWEHPIGPNSIGTLLYHIALIESDWLYTEILQRPIPEDLSLLFRLDARESNGKLTNVHDEPASRHEYRLRVVREQFLRTLSTMTLAEFRRVRRLPDYDVTPKWVVFHLLQHEAEHRGQVVVLRKLATT